MADAAAFDRVCEQLEQRTALDRLEARGTVRLALKEAGLDPRTLTPQQMVVVLQKVLPGELESRGVQEARQVCGALVAEIERLAAEARGPAAETPEDVFRRLAGAPSS